MACSVRCKRTTAFSVGTLLIVLGILMIVFNRGLYETILREQLTISEGTKGYSMWIETPLPMYMEVYLYNFTNYEEVRKSNWIVKPKMEECGPYVFLEHHSRSHFVWNRDDTVGYQQKRTWQFVANMTNGSLHDQIYNLNPIAVTIGYFMRDGGTAVKELVNFLLGVAERKLVINHTAGEWIFDGFDDPLFKIASELKIPGMMDKFGFFYGRNNSWTYDGNYTMYRGRTDLELLGLMEEWNGSSRTKFYKSYCGYVNGTSGELWPPIKGYKTVSIFSPDLCSTITLTRSEEQLEREGVEGVKFEGTDKVFDNGTKYADMACFTGSVRVPNGVRDVSKCKFGAPAFVSYPHFYLADPIYTREIDGMRPDPKKHKFSMGLEPDTGVPLFADAQLQINFLLMKIPGIHMFEKVKQLMIPMLWFRVSAELDSELASEVKVLLIVPKLLSYTGYGMLSIGLLVTLVASYLTIRRRWNCEESARLIAEEPK